MKYHSDMDSCTTETKDEVRNVFKVNSLDPNFIKFRCAFVPGLNKGHLVRCFNDIGINKKLKEIKNVSLFLFTLNCSNMLFDQNTIDFI